MLTLNHVLHPTDFSEASRQALLYAVALCNRFDSTLHLLHILTETSSLAIGPAGLVPAGMPEIQEQLRTAHEREADELLKAWIRPEDALNRPATRVTRTGSAFVEIIRYARDFDMDLIVLGTHGRGGIVHAVMGSVAEKVVRKSPCPVLTIRPDGHQFVMP